MNELFRRSYGLTVRAQKDEGRSVDVVASSTAIDGYGEIVAQDWDLRRYEANPVVLYGHSSWGMPIGHASNVRVEGEKLLATLNFVDARANPLAEQVWQGILQGSLRAVSVGFRSKKGSMQNIDGRDVYVLAGNELMEISVVPIPANPDAVAQEAKAFNDQLRALVARSQETPMSKPSILTLAALVPALALAASATEEDVLAEAGRLKALERDLLGATGAKSGAEALGVVQAGKAALARVGELEAEVAKAAEAAEARDRADLIEKGRAAKKLAPSLLDWAKACPLDALRSFLENAPAIPQLAAAPASEPGHTAATLTHDGKSWGELSPSEKHALYEANHDLYVAMRDAAKLSA